MIGETRIPDALRFAKLSRGKWFALTDAATIATDVSVSDFFYVTLGGNRTLGAPTNPPTAAGLESARILYRFRQDGTGTRTLAYNAAFRFPGGVTPVLTITAGKTDYLAFLYNEVDLVWDLVGSTFNL
jgi:hypothetical protein